MEGAGDRAGEGAGEGAGKVTGEGAGQGVAEVAGEGAGKGARMGAGEAAGKVTVAAEAVKVELAKGVRRGRSWSREPGAESRRRRTPHSDWKRRQL